MSTTVLGLALGAVCCMFTLWLLRRTAPEVSSTVRAVWGFAIYLPGTILAQLGHPVAVIVAWGSIHLALVFVLLARHSRVGESAWQAARTAVRRDRPQVH